jgi:acyl-CoA synthetase (AMP-forming)/AMP-acid ligase II
LIAFCRERLARYKVPARVHVVEALPRNAAGKLLRHTLAALREA